MHKASAIFALVVLGALVWVFFNRKPGIEQQIEKLDKRYKEQIDSLERVWKDSLDSENLRALRVFQEYIKKLDRAEGEKNHWKAKYTHEKNSNRHFTDASIDSLLESVR